MISGKIEHLLCRYRKRTDIYFSTWSFENVAKNCQFQFLDPSPKILLPVSELPVSVFRPPQILLPVSVLDPPRTIVKGVVFENFTFNNF